MSNLTLEQRVSRIEQHLKSGAPLEHPEDYKEVVAESKVPTTPKAVKEKK